MILNERCLGTHGRRRSQWSAKVPPLTRMVCRCAGRVCVMQVAPMDQNAGLDVLFLSSFLLTLMLAAAVILSLPVEWSLSLIFYLAQLLLGFPSIVLINLLAGSLLLSMDQQQRKPSRSDEILC